ncbi:MAG: tetratricopeptide repeat protein, partial [Pseudomonadota bacterium]|nr:tetratricopeptide repeat protein [Pseudomonadota bacterium]
VTPEQVSAMVDRLAQRLKERPDDAEGWQMLARSYVVLGKHADSIAAFRQAVRLAPANPDLLADFADALAMANGRSLAGEPSALVERALKIDANNPKALALAGTAAFDRHDYKGAVAAWETLAKLPGADASFVQQLQGSIAEARQLAGMPAATVSLLDPGASANDAGRAAQSVSGTVTLAPSLAGQVSPADTVFVFARAASGGRMPLGILRKKVSDLPLRFTLDDSMAMSPDAKLSSAARVVVGARVSKSGNAMPQGGDLQGLTDPVPVGSSDLRIEIDQAVAR